MYTDQQTLAAYFDAQPLPDMLAPKPRYNVAPSTWNPVILAAPPAGVGGEAPRHTRLMQWGLIPSWAKSNSKIRPINARSETAHEKPMFKHLMNKKRCIIPADGWYEWNAGQNGKTPYWHYHMEGEPLAFAGLWSSSSGDEGDAIESFTILTCKAHPEFANVHHRMPALLARENWQAWLDDGVDSAVAHQLIDLDSVHSVALEIEHFEISKEVNKVANDKPRLISQLRL